MNGELLARGERRATGALTTIVAIVFRRALSAIDRSGLKTPDSRGVAGSPAARPGGGIIYD
jgi:hypothetical protein